MITLYWFFDSGLKTTLRQSESDNDSISIFRETLLQALRGVIAGAGEKMGEPIRKALTTTLLGLLGHPDVSSVGVNQCS